MRFAQTLRLRLQKPLLLLSTLFVVGGVVGFATSNTACAPGSKPDKFLDAVVDCAKINPEASPAFAAVQNCLISALSQNYTACLAGLVTESHFLVDEIACIVAYSSQKANDRVAAGMRIDSDFLLRKNGNDWLRDKRIAIKNTYPGQQPQQ